MNFIDIKIPKYPSLNFYDSPKKTITFANLIRKQLIMLKLINTFSNRNS